MDALRSVKKFEASYRLGAVGLALAGLVVLFVAPAIVAGVTKIREMSVGRYPQHAYLHHFLIASLFVVPIMLLLARLIRGNLADKTVENLPGTYHPVETEIGGRAVAGLAFFDVLLWGPRMVLIGIGRLRSLKRHARAERALAGTIVGVLLARREGMLLTELTEAVHAPAETFADALAYLVHLEIADVSKEGDRIWLQSLAREKLNRF